MIVTMKNNNCDLVIFGTKGDLSRRKLIPALYQLEKKQKLGTKTRIIGVGRAIWNKDDYITLVRDSLKTFMLERINESVWNKFKNRLYFCNLDINNINQFNILKNILDQNKHIKINYFAVPPNMFTNICKGLGRSKLNHLNTRVVMEKPLGNSLHTFQEIDNQVKKYFSEKQIFRIDHYLGKETVINLLALRFANSLFIENWSNKIIDHIQITVAEEVGIEGRWEYFNKTGQMRDMVQNHMLQILSTIAMSIPSSLHANNIRDEKVKVLKSLRYIDTKDINKKTSIGQYTSGIIKGKKVISYLQESNNINNSITETFVSIRVDIDNNKWKGVPFYLRTGKRLKQKCSEIIIFFKTPLINIFEDSCKVLPQNKLRIRLQPNEGIDIQILNKVPGINHKYKLKETTLDLSYSKIFKKNNIVDAYERLLFESMRDAQDLFVRRDEIEESWKWVDSIILAWKQKEKKPELYQSGTWGPMSSLNIIKNDGRKWN
uniref:glucose-6-phosphate dehydrogenase n=1 Tax=Buchnera aphidicola TaxID=9 RepID=UPI003F5CEE58